MSPVLGSPLVAWMCLGTPHELLVAPVTDWELERGCNSGWHRCFLLGKREILQFPKSRGSAVISTAPSDSCRNLGFYSMGWG